MAMKDYTSMLLTAREEADMRLSQKDAIHTTTGFDYRKRFEAGGGGKVGLVPYRNSKGEMQDQSNFLLDYYTSLRDQNNKLDDYLKQVAEEPQPDTPRPERNPKAFSADVKAGNFTDRDLLALTIEGEAGGEGTKGMLAVGSVIQNRVNAKGFGDTLKDVILAPGQFSTWNNYTGYAKGEGGRRMDKMKPSKDAYAVADQILAGNYESPVGNVTHYYNPHDATPSWGREAGGDWQTIGNHIFGYAN